MKICILFTQKAAAKAILFRVGVIIGRTASYALTTCVGKPTCGTFRLNLEEEATAE